MEETNTEEKKEKEKFSLNQFQTFWLITLMLIVFISVTILLSFNNENYAKGLSQGFICSEINNNQESDLILVISQEDLDNCKKVIELYYAYQNKKYGGDENFFQEEVN